MHPEYIIVSTVKHGGESIMVWGCFSSNGIGDWIKTDGTMTKEVYNIILKNNAILSGVKLIGK